MSISEGAFTRNSDLMSLKLDGNRISQVSNRTFYGLANAQVISLRGNEITSLPGHLFKFAPKVQKIDLARNSISSIHAQAFQGLSSEMKILHLENNFLSQVPIEALRPLVALAELHLAGNPLKIIASNAFVHFHSLTRLDLASCRLGQIQDLAFNGLGTLKHLKLSDNNLSQIPSEALRRVPNLLSLHLGQNPLSELPTAAAPALNQLKTLDISGCSKLTQIHSGAFQGLLDLKHVTISLNRALQSIDPQAFDSAMTNLHSLNLADNGLSSISSKLVPWSKLKSLDLSGNPWQCSNNCQLAFMPTLLHELIQKTANKTSDNRIIAGKCTNGQSLFDTTITCQEPQEEIIEENEILTKEEVMLRHHEATNATAVIVSVSIVSTVVLLTILMFIYLKWCKTHVQDWIKEYKWRRADARSLSHKTINIEQHHGQYYQPYLKSDNYIYTSPRLHHTYVYHGQSPVHQQYFNTTQNTTTTTSTDNDDEYFYVSNHHDTAVVINNGYATHTAKHIPVTVL